MSSRGDTREQPSTREPSSLRAEHAYLLIGAGSFTAAIVVYAVDATLPIEINRGAYSIMVALFVAGYCGWLSRSAERRMRRVAVGELQRLATAVEELRDQVARQRTVYLPAPRQPCDGQRYMSSAVGRQGDTVPLMPIVNPDTEAVLRRINMRLVNGDSDRH